MSKTLVLSWCFTIDSWTPNKINMFRLLLKLHIQKILNKSIAKSQPIMVINNALAKGSVAT